MMFGSSNPDRTRKLFANFNDNNMIPNLPPDQHGGPRSLWVKLHPELFLNEQVNPAAEAELVSRDTFEDNP